MSSPETRYTRSGDLCIAYQIVGEGPLDLVWIPSGAHHVELNWENALVAGFLKRLASMSRLLLFDKRGTGMSDRVAGTATLEERMDDIRAVMDAAGSDRAVLTGLGDGGPLCALFAATYPERTSGLVLLNSSPRMVRSPELPWLPTRAEAERRMEELVGTWADPEAFVKSMGRFSPSATEEERRGFARMVRLSVSPGSMLNDVTAGKRWQAEPDRVLSTVLFTDIVGATTRAAELGDRAWGELLQKHHDAIRRELGRFRGQEVDTAGDGFFATFDGPARAIRCACAIRESLGELDLQVRAGLHTGECERNGEKVTGIAVHIGARVAAIAESGEVLVSRTVKDLVAGSGIELDDRGEYELKGVPGDWQLFAVKAL